MSRKCMYIYLFLFMCFIQNFKDVMRCPWKGLTIRQLTSPAPNWGPALPQHRRLRESMNQATEEDIIASTNDQPVSVSAISYNMEQDGKDKIPVEPPPKYDELGHDNPALVVGDEKN